MKIPTLTSKLLLIIWLMQIISVIMGASLFVLHYYAIANALLYLSLIAYLIYCILCINDVIKREMDWTMKLLWCLSIITFPFLGGLVYYVLFFKRNLIIK